MTENPCVPGSTPGAAIKFFEICGCGGMADTLGSNSNEGNFMEVQVLSTA